MIIKWSILTLSPIGAQGVPLITNVTPNKGTYPNISKSTAKEYLLRKRDKGELIEVKVKRALMRVANL